MRLDDGCVATGSKFQYSGGPVRSEGGQGQKTASIQAQR